MENTFVVILCFNYIFSITIFFVSLFQNWTLTKFVVFLMISLCLLNIAIFFFNYLMRMFIFEKEEHTFEMNIDISDDEAKDLLRQVNEVNDEEKQVEELGIEESEVEEESEE